MRLKKRQEKDRWYDTAENAPPEVLQRGVTVPKVKHTQEEETLDRRSGEIITPMSSMRQFQPGRSSNDYEQYPGQEVPRGAQI